MFFHNFKYTFINLFKKKALIFWTFAFPIILGTFFSLAFRDIETKESFDIMDIAIINNENFQTNEIWKSSFEKLSTNEEEKLFHISYVDSIEEAEKLLEEDKIIGYLLLEEEPKIIIEQNGTYQTIFKMVVEEIKQTETMLTNIIEKNISEDSSSMPNIDRMINTIRDTLAKEVNITDSSSNHLSYTMIEFYTLIAMTCLYGGILGMVAINQILPNMSNTGRRIAVSAISKGKLVLSSVLASYCIQLIGLALLFLYTVFILKVDYGNQYLRIILLSILGSFAGLALGISVATMFKTSDSTKMGIILSITMLGCFLSGMMGITMKYVIDKNLPILNIINPANMITDGFYSLYYYDTLDRFHFNLISLLICSSLLIFLSIIFLRRQKYESI